MATTTRKNVLTIEHTCLKFVFFVLICQQVTCIEEDGTEVDKSILTLDNKQEGETLCNPQAFRKTFPAADLLGHCVNMLRPGAPIGDRCFQVNRTMSVDCLWWNPKGFNVQRERFGQSNVEQTWASSILELSHDRQFGVSASVSVQTASIGVSASTEYEKRKKTASSMSRKMEYMLAFMRQIDHQAEMSLAFPPDVAEHLVKIVQTLEAAKRRIRRRAAKQRTIITNNSIRPQNQTVSAMSQEEMHRLIDEEQDKVFCVISRAGTHILLKSVFGSETNEVSLQFFTEFWKVQLFSCWEGWGRGGGFHSRACGQEIVSTYLRKVLWMHSSEFARNQTIRKQFICQFCPLFCLISKKLKTGNCFHVSKVHLRVLVQEKQFQTIHLSFLSMFLPTEIQNRELFPSVHLSKVLLCFLVGFHSRT
jgi:hypothetical protein